MNHGGITRPGSRRKRFQGGSRWLKQICEALLQQPVGLPIFQSQPILRQPLSVSPKLLQQRLYGQHTTISIEYRRRKPDQGQCLGRGAETLESPPRGQHPGACKMGPEGIKHRDVASGESGLLFAPLGMEHQQVAIRHLDGRGGGAVPSPLAGPLDAEGLALPFFSGEDIVVRDETRPVGCY